MSRGRAYTRHQRERFWNRTREFIRTHWLVGSWHADWTDEQLRNLTNHRYKNRQPCSCPMCSWRREFTGPTVQELRQYNIDDFDDYRWELLDI